MIDKTQDKLGPSDGGTVSDVDKAKKEGLVQQTGPVQPYDVDHMQGHKKPQTPAKK
jgi:hypothetical protein